MNPGQLWETTMNPETRTLLQVKLEDMAGVDEIFYDSHGRRSRAAPQFHSAACPGSQKSRRLVRTLLARDRDPNVSSGKAAAA